MEAKGGVEEKLLCKIFQFHNERYLKNCFKANSVQKLFRRKKKN